jgi:hypothetical protein
MREATKGFDRDGNMLKGIDDVAGKLPKRSQSPQLVSAQRAQ